jgi:hypothetical protein
MIQNFSKDFTQLDIPDEVSKTFGRTINLKLCSALVKEYVKEHDLKPTDYFITKNLWTINKYLRDNCGKMFGKDKISHPKAKGLYGNFTLYDIRHNSSCYWLNRYPTHKGLMYRFGWKKADKIEYYSEFLGVKDEIMDSDMVLAEDKPKLFKLEEDNKELRKDLNDLKNVLKFYFETEEYMIPTSQDFKEIKNSKERERTIELFRKQVENTTL